jgi:CRP-like cAMP-binding protein
MLDVVPPLMGEAHAASVRTRTPVLLCELDHDVLRRLFAGSATGLMRIAANLARLQPSRGSRVTAPQDILHHLRRMFPDAALAETD